MQFYQDELKKDTLSDVGGFCGTVLFFNVAV